MYKLEYLPSALRDMTEIARYISAELKSPAAAEKLAHREGLSSSSPFCSALWTRLITAVLSPEKLKS